MNDAKTIDLHNLRKQYDGVNAISIAHKYTNGVNTSNLCVKFSVNEKKSLSKIKEDQIIPKEVTIDGVVYPTDVVQKNTLVYKLNQIGCYGWQYGTWAAPNRRNRTTGTFDVFSGGMSIGTREIGGTGTMGALVKDLADDTIVGLTNNHVIIEDAFLASEKVILTSRGLSLDGKSIKERKVIQPGLIDSRSSNTTVPSQSQVIGRNKRYVPMRILGEGQLNTVDAAIFSFEAFTDRVTSESTKQTNMFDSIYDYPLADGGDTITVGMQVWKSGRTSGFTGHCPMEIYETNLETEVGYYDFSGYGAVVTFSKCLFFSYSERINGWPRGYALLPGDSGSVLIGDVGGTKKIIGLNFAGGSVGFGAEPGNYCIACLMSEVKAQLNIGSLSSSEAGSMSHSNPSTWKWKRSIGLDPNAVTTIDGESGFYQGGLVRPIGIC